jgi:hypothetical protein
MFAAIGWIWIEEAEYPDEFGDPASEPRPAALAAVSEVLARLAEPERAVLHVRNAEFTILINHHSNHRLGWPIELFREIARVAPGSFGYLHVYDDEHPAERYRFMRWSMIHGRIEVEEDLALVPVVREWYDGVDPRAPYDSR